MKAITRLIVIIAIFSLYPTSLTGLAQTSSANVHAKLLLASDKTTYRIGEPIKLIIEFTSDSDGYQVETIPDGWQPTNDLISVSPTGGVTPWLEEYFGSYPHSRDAFSLQNLLSTPIRVELVLNDTLRFDKPGKYSVQVTTKRVSPQSASGRLRPVVLTTNSVSIEIQPMSETDETKEVKRIAGLLDAGGGVGGKEGPTRELMFLTGEASTREKVRRFVDAEGRSGNDGHFGLFIARNRMLVLKLLETAMRDPNTPVTRSLLSAITKLRVWLDYNGAKPLALATTELFGQDIDPRQREIAQTYLAELAAGLGKRVGKSQTTTAITILLHLPKDTQPADPALTEVRSLLIERFDNLGPFEQEYLLRMFWDRLRTPELIPSLEKMLGYGGMSSKNVHDSALKSLIDISPDRARRYVVAEVRDPHSLVDYEIMQSLPDVLLPEVDGSLVKQLRTLTASKVNFDQVYLKEKASLAARYGSESIYPDMMELYGKVSAELPLEIRACFFAYFAKHNEAEGLSLIQKTLDDLPPGQNLNFLSGLTRLYYSEALDSVLIKRLDSDEHEVAGVAAYLISRHGPASDQKVLEAKLEEWQKKWRPRLVEADATSQGSVELELISALGLAKSWKLSPEQFKELQQRCITKICRKHYQLH